MGCGTQGSRREKIERGRKLDKAMWRKGLKDQRAVAFMRGIFPRSVSMSRFITRPRSARMPSHPTCPMYCLVFKNGHHPHPHLRPHPRALIPTSSIPTSPPLAAALTQTVSPFASPPQPLARAPLSAGTRHTLSNTPEQSCAPWLRELESRGPYRCRRNRCWGI